MTWNEFFQSLKEESPARVYLFAGPEEWIKNEALEALRAHLLPAGLESLNDLTLEGVGASQIIDAAETMPMMCDRRIVTVRDWVPLLPGKSKNEDAEAERILKWLDNPPESCVTVFYMRSDPDGRKKTVSALKKKACVVQFDFMTDSELAKWVAKRLKPLNKKMSSSAVSTLTFMVGHDLTRLAGELDKLCAFTEDRAEIAQADIRAIVAPSLEYNIFELLNLLLAGNLGDAQRMVNSLLQNGQTAIGLLAMLTRQLRQLTHMRLGLNAGQSVEQIQGLMKLHPYAAKQTAKQCRGLSAEGLKQLYESCVSMDFDIKSGRLRDLAALESMLIKITSAKLAEKKNA